MVHFCRKALLTSMSSIAFVKATFFSVGMMAERSPLVLQRAAADGHTIGTHTQTHPLRMNRLPIDRARAEIDTGVASVKAALGDHGAVAPSSVFPASAGPRISKPMPPPPA
jgi:peptidoglycan/xylan/chitin deacetylase (PgdA/CDA1 family)